MDAKSNTLQVWNNLPNAYQDKFMDLDLYDDTYNALIRLIEKRNPSIFEIGCGPGNITRYLLKRRPDFQITGIDLAPNMVKLASENNPDAQFMVMDCREIGSLTDRYDAIVCGFCLPYLTKEETAKLISDSADLLTALENTWSEPPSSIGAVRFSPLTPGNAAHASDRSAFIDRRRRPFGETPHQPDLVVADFSELAARML